MSNVVIWTYFLDGKTIYKLFKDAGISDTVKKEKEITYVRFVDGHCFYRYKDSSEEDEKKYFKEWKDDGYELQYLTKGTREYVGVIWF